LKRRIEEELHRFEKFQLGSEVVNRSDARGLLQNSLSFPAKAGNPVRRSLSVLN
jgi:hypothetical protein